MTTTVLKKSAPSRSFPSRQRKLGPAPFASFEDLSDDMESPLVEVMPPHVEEEAHSSSYSQHQPVTATSSSTGGGYSQPTSGLQTPSTPRIDISCASSSTPPSEDSDKELFQGGLGFAFHEEGTEELRSSTEELDLGQIADDIDSEEEKRQKREDKEELRRGSHPANIFSCRRKSSNNNYGGGAESSGGDDLLSRKPSAHTLFLDNLLSRHTRHASFGAGDNNYTRPGAISSLSAHSSGSTRGRSPSPHKMMLETSFCGSKPIPTKSMDIPDNDPLPQEVPLPLPQEVIIPPKSERSLSIKSIIIPHSTSPSPTHNNNNDSSRRPSSCGRRSVSPFKMMLETSFCGSKPIPTKSMEVPDYSPPSLEDTTPTQVTTAQVHYMGGGGEPCSPKSSDHWRPVTPKSWDGVLVADGAISPSESSPSQSTAKYVTTPNPAANLKLHTTNIFKYIRKKTNFISKKVSLNFNNDFFTGGLTQSQNKVQVVKFNKQKREEGEEGEWL
jgi:hypothetical protein